MPVRNEAESVDSTLSSLMESTMLPDEILCADGRSTDNTIELIEAFAKAHPEVSIRVVDNPGKWSGSGRNRAIEVAKGNVILIADFGNTFRANWIEEMSRPFFVDPDVDIVCGLFQPHVTTDFEHCVAVIHMFDDYTLHLVPREERDALLPEVVVPVGMAMGMTRDAWARLGGFPEWLFKGQDKLFGRKAWAQKYKIVVAWDALVDHHVRPTPERVFNYLYYYGRGFGQQKLLSNMTKKLGMIYGVFFLLVIAGFFAPVFWLLALVLAGAHLWKFGFKKLLKQNLRPWKWSYLYQLPVALVARDLGSIFGHIAGWKDWLTQPELRAKQSEFLKGTDPKRLRIVSK
nr:glycosyltransferase [Litoreibacter janthinus]